MKTILNLLQSQQYQKKSALEKIICHRLGISKTELFAHSEQEVGENDAKRIHDAYTSYIQEHKPLEYVLGHVEFAGLKFTVNKNTLIPRPETEYMIDAVREHIGEGRSANKEYIYNLLDIGTGCGVLGCSVLYHCGEFIPLALLADLSPDALTVAQKNYDRIMGDSRSGQDTLLISNLLDHPDIYSVLDNFDIGNECIIVANLPYIPDELFDKNADPTVHDREPRMAFVGGNDGLDLYRIMLGQIEGRTKGNAAITAVLFLEMMTWQVDILRQEYPGRIFDEIKTFHFNIRIVRARMVGKT